MRIRHVAALALFVPLLAGASPTLAQDPLVRSMKDEIDRSMNRLELEGFTTPYYIAYTAVDSEDHHCAAQDGGLLADDHVASRLGRVDVRVGSPQLDSGNTDFSWTPASQMAVADDYLALRREWWLRTDRQYKRAVEALEKRKARHRTEKKKDDRPPSFSMQDEVSSPPAAKPVTIDDPDVECRGLVKKVSTALRDTAGVHSAEVTAIARYRVRTFVSSEGGLGQTPESTARISILLRGQTEDGSPVVDFATIDADDWDGLPSEKEVMTRAKALGDRFAATVRAKSAEENYLGPVLFEGRAAAQLMRQLLVPRLIGTPPVEFVTNPDEPPEKSKALRLGRRVFPDSFEVFDDPTIETLEEEILLGHYAFDHEGIPAEKVELVRQGFVRSYLMSRAPREKLQRSNGHARSPGPRIDAMPGNFVVKASGGVSDARLERELLRQAKREGLDHAFVVTLLDDRAITAGAEREYISFDSGQPELPPLVVYRVNADGSREPVREMRVVLPLIRDLKHLVAWGQTPNSDHDTGIGNPGPGYFVAGSFAAPSSVVTPDLLFEEVELRAGGGSGTPPAYAPPAE